ncbi:MAG: hypothetical protein WKG00_10625 [Polyangiaceae bacterium]
MFDVVECVGVIEDAVDYARIDGDMPLAARYWRIALAAWECEASMATSGGEGRSRMLDVERVRAKLVRERGAAEERKAQP